MRRLFKITITIITVANDTILVKYLVFKFQTQFQ